MQDRDQYVIPVCPMRPIPLKKDDTWCHIQAGGGGHGEPLERPVELVLEAFLNEMISEAYAAEIYGVVIKKNAIDLDATRDCVQKKSKSEGISIVI